MVLNRHISCCNSCTRLQRCSTFCARSLLSSSDQICHGVIRVQSENVQPTLCECSITSEIYGPTSLMFHSTSAALTCLSSVKRSLRLTLLSKRLQTCQCLQNTFEQSCHHEHDCCTCSSQMARKGLGSADTNQAFIIHQAPKKPPSNSKVLGQKILYIVCCSWNSLLLHAGLQR